MLALGFSSFSVLRAIRRPINPVGRFRKEPNGSAPSVRTGKSDSGKKMFLTRALQSALALDAPETGRLIALALAVLLVFGRVATG